MLETRTGLSGLRCVFSLVVVAVHAARWCGSKAKLSALHRAMKADPALATYFASDFYCKYAVNNAMYSWFCGAGYGKGPFGPTVEEAVKVR